MRLNRKQFLAWMLLSALMATPSIFIAAQNERKLVHKPDVPFTGTANEVVDAMSNTAKVSEQDMVYDLGCGDGRIVIAAARNYGAHGVGVDINPARIKESKRNAKKAGVDQKLRFITQDFFKTDL